MLASEMRKQCEPTGSAVVEGLNATADSFYSSQVCHATLLLAYASCVSLAFALYYSGHFCINKPVRSTTDSSGGQWRPTAVTSLILMRGVDRKHAYVQRTLFSACRRALGVTLMIEMIPCLRTFWSSTLRQ